MSDEIISQMIVEKLEELSAGYMEQLDDIIEEAQDILDGVIALEEAGPTAGRTAARRGRIFEASQRALSTLGGHPFYHRLDRLIPQLKGSIETRIKAFIGRVDHSVNETELAKAVASINNMIRGNTAAA